MRVIMPYTRLRGEVVEALADWPVEFVDVSADDEAYWHLLSEAWLQGDSFIIVEHDIVVRPDTLQELIDCRHDWCVMRTEWFSEAYPGLGCAKFTRAILLRHPYAMAAVAEMEDNSHPKRHWCRLDAWLQAIILPQCGEWQHIHEGTPLRHLHDGVGMKRPTHGCVG